MGDINGFSDDVSWLMRLPAITSMVRDYYITLDIRLAVTRTARLPHPHPQTAMHLHHWILAITFLAVYAIASSIDNSTNTRNDLIDGECAPLVYLFARGTDGSYPQFHSSNTDANRIQRKVTSVTTSARRSSTA